MNTATPNIGPAERFFTATAVFLPPLGVLIAIILTWGFGVNATHLVLAGVFYLLTGFGITVGYHRLFTHHSFKATPWLRVTLGILGGMALEGKLFDWCTWHAWHHQHSDEPEDQHSPHHSGNGFFGTLRGFTHAHMGWIFSTTSPDEKLSRRLIPRLWSDPLLVFVNNHFVWWVILSLALPTLLGGLLEWSWKGAALGFLWGGLVRIFLVHHITWSINSVCHIWGSRPHDTGDKSTNHWVMGIIGLGEGWHNTHHHCPYSARHGLKWWEFDASYMLIKLLEKLGAVSDVRVPKDTSS